MWNYKKSTGLSLMATIHIMKLALQSIKNALPTRYRVIKLWLNVFNSKRRVSKSSHYTRLVSCTMYKQCSFCCGKLAIKFAKLCYVFMSFPCAPHLYTEFRWDEQCVLGVFFATWIFYVKRKFIVHVTTLKPKYKAKCRLINGQITYFRGVVCLLGAL